jgi:hypothetical protein
LKIKISKIGLLLVVIGTFVYLFSYLIGFVLDSSATSYSCIIEKSDKITQQMTCYVKDHRDFRAGIFLTGVITAIIIVFGNILVEYGHKNQESLTKEFRLKAKGYQ